MNKYQCLRCDTIVKSKYILSDIKCPVCGKMLKEISRTKGVRLSPSIIKEYETLSQNKDDKEDNKEFKYKIDIDTSKALEAIKELNINLASCVNRDDIIGRALKSYKPDFKEQPVTISQFKHVTGLVLDELEKVIDTSDKKINPPHHQ
ncbi:hypothetical protein SH1V18_15020 [Vallitalea longa]|uniref:Uncharacterized protein n=1 Tax=Vallitalea longa TaxID=2936439 RepID=A0A9W5Y8W7_9FIRM|nr:hypothetical protein [Vallitalea longa]GKX29022.1 hypothetical protein SH1V18_15020 [Vallitalea longa]